MTFRHKFNCCEATLNTIRETFYYKSIEMAWSDKTRHKMFLKCCFYSPSVLYNVDFSFKNTHTHMQNVIEILLENDVSLLTSSLSSSPAIVRNARILNLPKFVSICWCEYYLTLKLTKIPLVSCIRA